MYIVSEICPRAGAAIRLGKTRQGGGRVRLVGKFVARAIRSDPLFSVDIPLGRLSHVRVVDHFELLPMEY